MNKADKLLKEMGFYNGLKDAKIVYDSVVKQAKEKWEEYCILETYGLEVNWTLKADVVYTGSSFLDLVDYVYGEDEHRANRVELIEKKYYNQKWIGYIFVSILKEEPKTVQAQRYLRDCKHYQKAGEIYKKHFKEYAKANPLKLKSFEEFTKDLINQGYVYGQKVRGRM